MSSFTKNIALTFSSRFLAAIFTSLSTILISRAFGPVGKGIFTMVAFFPTLALQFGHLGLGNANTYLISQDKEKTRKSFYNSFWYGLIIGWLFIVIFSLIYRYSPTSILGKGNIGNWAFYLSLLAIPFILWENFYQGIFVGRQEFKFFNLISLLSKILLFFGLVVLIFYFKVGLENLKYAIIYYVILMTLPAVIYSIYFLTQFGFPFEFDKLIFKKAIDFGLRSYVSCLLAFLVLRSDIYLLNYFKGFEDVGYYSIAVGFCDGILLIISSITLVLFPKITENQSEGLNTTLKVSRLSSLMLILIIIFSFIFGKTIILLLFGYQFLKSLIPLLLL
jgi:O-antigen/teichoic acid export membrane protein